MTCIINASTTNNLQISSDGSGIVKVQSNGVTTNALAWINFNGSSGATASRAAYNVSSVTRNSTGLYTLSFTNSLTDANYVICGSDSYLLNANGASGGVVSFINKATSSVQIITNSANTPQDSIAVDIAIFGN